MGPKHKLGLRLRLGLWQRLELGRARLGLMAEGRQGLGLGLRLGLRHA